MYTQIAVNNVKEGCLDSFIEANKAFMADIAAAPGCIEARAYVNKAQKVVNLVSWEKQGDEEIVMTGGILKKHGERLGLYFEGNTMEELWSV